MNLRPAQAEILKYEGGRLAVSAVPGSGKTFTLSLLAAELIATGRLDPQHGQQILIVTYLHSSVETFRNRIRQHLTERQLDPIGYDVRTLHSLSLDIIRSRIGRSGISEDLIVADELQTSGYLARAVDNWIDEHKQTWNAFLPNQNLQMEIRWRDRIERTAKDFIRSAKNHQYTPEIILSRIDTGSAEMARQAWIPPLKTTFEENFLPDFSLIWMLAGIYQRYQIILARLNALDFNDLIWLAVESLEKEPELIQLLKTRWSYILEDEAQDSVPLQEKLLSLLCGQNGNWVRVGDPNQSITSTFTSADPRQFMAFLDRPEVLVRPLPNSGRSAPIIYEAANELIRWVHVHHPIPEVQNYAFRVQDILPTPPDDVQQNPPNREADFKIRVYGHREDGEIPAIARQVARQCLEESNYTIAILTPTNAVGRLIAAELDELDAPYDDLLRGSGRTKEIAAALSAVLGLLGEPTINRNLLESFEALAAIDHPISKHQSDPAIIKALLRSIYKPESMLFPEDFDEIKEALPENIASETDLEYFYNFTDFLRQLFQYKQLPIDDLILSISYELYSRDKALDRLDQAAELAITFQIAGVLRQWQDMHPDWRLPELVAQLTDVAKGYKQLNISGPKDVGYEPEPGRITLATQHGAKGMEWDIVYLVGIDGVWIPGSLDAPFVGVDEMLGGDLPAEAVAQLFYLMEGDSRLYPGRTATESAKIDLICERLRLLYVGITRARRMLYISRSRKTSRNQQDIDMIPATALGAIYDYLKRLPGREVD